MRVHDYRAKFEVDLFTISDYFSIFLALFLLILLPIFLIILGIKKAGKATEDNDIRLQEAKKQFELQTTCKWCNKRDLRISKESQYFLSSATSQTDYSDGQPVSGYCQTQTDVDRFIIYCKQCRSRIDENKFVFSTSKEQSASYGDSSYTSGLGYKSATLPELESRWLAENYYKTSAGGGYIIIGGLLLLLSVCMYYLFKIGIL